VFGVLKVEKPHEKEKKKCYNEPTWERKKTIKKTLVY
jgi:hypothetical protein